MPRDFVWAIDEDGKPCKCFAKPENRGKRNCRHRFHQKEYQSDEAFFAEHQVSMTQSIFSASQAEVTRYKMTEEEKEGLLEITSRKALQEQCDEGGYIHLAQPLWNDMDKNAYCDSYCMKRKDLDTVIHEEAYIAIIADDEHGIAVGDVLSNDDYKNLGAIEKLAYGTGVEAMNLVAKDLHDFVATEDVYVLPYYMRPDTVDIDGNSKESQMTFNYKHLFNRRAYSAKSQQLAYEGLLTQGIKYGSAQTSGLAESLRGKKGLWRHDITGFTVPYTGRAVIAPDVSLTFDEMALPTTIAADIFKPTIMQNLSAHGFSKEEALEVVKDAKRDPRTASPMTVKLISRALEEENVRVLGNRQPTLHSASIESFKPKIVNDSAIRVNPLVCGGFGADFDGDTMAVYGLNSAEISEKADAEMSPKNFKYTPRDHTSLNMEPTKDAKWGIMNVLKRRSDK